MNISGYIPSRNRTQVAFPERGFEEMAWGPSLLLSQEKAQKSEIENLGADISNNSYYLDADDKNVAPIVESLQKEADDLATEAATKGYDPMLSNKLIAFRRKYQKALSQNEPWGKAIINYKDATAQWKQWEEEHKNDPQEFKQKAKKHFFGQYQGAVDDETPGQLRGFDAGSLPNYYDVNKDIREALRDATGKLGQVVGSEGSSIKIDTSSGVPMLRVFNSSIGQYMDNLQPLLAGAQAVLDDYSGGYGADTDRARFAKVQGITPEYLVNTVGNLTKSQRDSHYSQLPSSSGSYQNIPERTKKQEEDSEFVAAPFSGIETNSKLQKEVNNNFSILDKAVVNGKFSPSSITSSTVVGRGLGALNNLTGAVSKETGLPVDDILKYTPPVLIASGLNNLYENWSEKSTEDKATTIWEGYKDKYKNYYDPISQGKTIVVGGKTYSGDGGFKELAKASEQLTTAQKVSDFNLAVNKPTEFIFSNTKESKDVKNRPNTWIDSEGKGYTKAQIQKYISESGLADVDFPTLVDSEGNLYLELYTDKKLGKVEKFTLSPTALADNVKSQWDYAKAIESRYGDLSLSPEEISTINSNNLTLSRSRNKLGETKTEELDTYINPNNPLERRMEVVTTITDSNGKKWEVPNSRRPANISELYGKALKGLFTGVTFKNKP